MTTITTKTAPLGRRIEVSGVVQGVGFRPFVWRLARHHGLTGKVRNVGGRVEIEVEGSARDLDRFRAALESEAPRRATVVAVTSRDTAPTGYSSFVIDRSETNHAGTALVAPDLATCAACLEELFDPDDRRHRYPFINCVDCGPRYTVIESLPYDRERTSMRAFPMCPACAREYDDPSDRRFHAEPTACPACGPQLQLLDSEGSAVCGDPLEGAAARLLAGDIVAIKALGGFHLACDATDEAAVHELRRRKRRPDKPFAVMVRDLEVAVTTFRLSNEESDLLQSWRAPIVLVGDRGYLAPSVAPGHQRQGAMLPATPLHHLLTRAVDRPLVMTSGNHSDEPICTDNDEALACLADAADFFLVHDRGVVARYDDSVTAVRRGGPVVLRRARGFAPEPIPLGATGPPVLSCGGHLQVSFCLAVDSRAFVSPHIGDLDNDMAVTAFREALERSTRLFDIAPSLVAHDRHPDFLTTRLAETLGVPTVAVQHHHAHVAAVMAEHQLDGRVLGVAFDGFGLGEDGASWGGEFLAVDARDAVRVGHLRPVAQPGGDAAVREPNRMAFAHAVDASRLTEARALFSDTLTDRDMDSLAAQSRSPRVAPPTTSAGRLFDAVAALLGLGRTPSYEGQPAILLEQAADATARGAYPVPLDTHQGRLVIDTRALVAAVIDDRIAGRSVADISGRFHHSLAGAIVAVCDQLRERTGLDRVCLGGGVFANGLLLDEAAERLLARRFEVYWPQAVPPGDGGLALGQVHVARARSAVAEGHG